MYIPRRDYPDECREHHNAKLSRIILVQFTAILTCVISFVFQVSHSHAVAESAARFASKSDRSNCGAKHFLPRSGSSKCVQCDFSLSLSLFFFNAKKGGKERDALYKHDYTMPADSRYMRRGLVRYV